ncbi:MAG: type II toxin-antitoxin system VapC family toxin [Chloroflexota bacterium]
MARVKDLVLLDTSALFASLDRDDPNHLAARRFLEATSVAYLVTETVFREAMTLIKLHLGVAHALRTGQALLAGDPFHSHRLSAEELSDTWQVFSHFTDKEWSYTDCSIRAVARRANAERVFAFDRHFDQMAPLGLQRVP